MELKLGPDITICEVREILLGTGLPKVVAAILAPTARARRFRGSRPSFPTAPCPNLAPLMVIRGRAPALIVAKTKIQEFALQLSAKFVRLVSEVFEGRRLIGIHAGLQVAARHVVNGTAVLKRNP